MKILNDNCTFGFPGAVRIMKHGGYVMRLSWYDGYYITIRYLNATFPNEWYLYDENERDLLTGDYRRVDYLNAAPIRFNGQTGNGLDEDFTADDWVEVELRQRE